MVLTTRYKILLGVAAICILIAVISWSAGESNSTGVVLLTALSAAGSLGIGAYTGARETHRLEEAADKERRDRERDGLLRLLYTEVFHNALHIDYTKMELDHPLTSRGALAQRGRYVNAEVWKATRVDLTQSGLSSQHFAVLADYYKNILLLEEVVTLERRRKDENPTHQTSNSMIYQTRPLLQALQEIGNEAQALIRGQIPDVAASDRYAELVQELVRKDV